MPLPPAVDMLLDKGGRIDPQGYISIHMHGMMGLILPVMPCSSYVRRRKNTLCLGRYRIKLVHRSTQTYTGTFSRETLP
jgi:hypothetical protein